MRRKKPGKGTRAKSAPKNKALNLDTFHKRNTKRISIVFPKGKKPVNDVEASLISFNWKKIDYMTHRNKRTDEKTGRKHYIPPRGVVLIITIHKGKEDLIFTKVSPLTMVVNKDTIKDFIADTIIELEDNHRAAKDSIKEANESGDEPEEVNDKPAEYVEKLDVKFIKDITIHFIY